MSVKADTVKAKQDRTINNHRDLWIEVTKQGRELAAIKTENRVALALLAGIILKLLFS